MHRLLPAIVILAIYGLAALTAHGAPPDMPTIADFTIQYQGNAAPILLPWSDEAEAYTAGPTRLFGNGDGWQLQWTYTVPGGHGTPTIIPRYDVLHYAPSTGWTPDDPDVTIPTQALPEPGSVAVLSPFVCSLLWRRRSARTSSAS